MRDADETPASISMTPFWVLLGVYIIALADMPYGYYMITRLITCGMALWLLLRMYSLRKTGDGLLWALAVVAIIYNPLVPIYLHSKLMWTLINVGTLGLFWFAIQTSRSIAPARNSG